jgi:hypothetical protein
MVMATRTGALNPVEAPVKIRSGATLPFAVRAKTLTELLLALATANSLFTVSTARPTGVTSPVEAPERVRSGATLPFAVRA